MQFSIPICRVCLKTSLEYIDLETPFGIDATSSRDVNTSELTNNKEFTYLDCFRECTRLDVDCGDNVSQSLCGNCGMELRISYEFIKKAENAAKILQQAAEKTKLEVLGTTVRNEALIDEENVLEFCEYEEVLEHDSSEQRLQEEVISSNEEEEILKCKFNDESEHYHHDEFYKTDIFQEVDEAEMVEEHQNSRTEENELSDIEELQNIPMEEHGSDASMKMDEIVFKNINTENNLQEQCASCEETCSENLSLDQYKHRRNSVTYSCKICQIVFSNKILHRQHIRIEHSHILKCTKCDFQGTELKVFEHEQIKHQEQQVFLCNICSKTFATLGILNAHLKYHQRKQANIKSDACNICGKQFSTKHYLRLHMQVHTNDRESYKCSQCEKIYVTKTALDNHMKLHNGETIKCVSCDKEFSRQYELNVHMRFHTRDYPFECEMCGKKFAIKGHLRTHMWRHQGLKLQCEDCGKLFTSSKALQEHSFTHSEMPYPCSYCPKAYPSKQKFKVHLKTAHSIELNKIELQKIKRNVARKPLLRKKLTLVQADSVMKEVEVKTKDDEYEEVQEFDVKLF